MPLVEPPPTQIAIQIPSGHDDLLPDLAALPVRADDLEVFILTAPANTTFIPHEHAINMQISNSIVKHFQGLIEVRVGTTFSEFPLSHLTISTSYSSIWLTTIEKKLREKPKWRTHKGESTEAGHSGGTTRSSGEVP
jgi:hypothetical protein